MRKIMYSLMLSENVVAAIDRLAYESGTNRSNMINSILAEYVSYRTPEMRMREMFEKMEELISLAEGFKVMLRSSDSYFNLRSALSYKYNPTINYSIELYRAVSDSIGELRVSLRTQNNSLKLYIMQFFKLWSQIECSYPGSNEFSIDGEKFIKKLILRSEYFSSENISEEDLSNAIVEYIYAFDGAIKAFFYNLGNPSEAISQVEDIYKKYRIDNQIIM